MTLLDDIGQPDLGLVTEVRSGRAEAFAELYRRHQPAVLRYALAMTRGDEARAQDLVSEAFVRVFDAVSAGRGSEVAFRPYVLAAVRNEYVTELRRFGRVDLVESPEQLDDYAPYGRDADDELDPKLCRAFRRLPHRWQVVLWHTEIEDDRPAEVARILGVSPNAVAALASRARERLRQEYLQEHVDDIRPECRPYAGRLARLVRGKLSWRDRRSLNAHLESCPDCARTRADLTKLNSEMRGVLAPALLGLGGAGPLLSNGIPAVVPAVAGASSASGWLGWTGLAGSGATLGHGLGALATAGLGGASLAQLGAGAAAAAVATMAVFGMSVPPPPQDAEDPVLAAAEVSPSPDGEESPPTAADDGEPEETAAVAPTPTPSPEPTEDGESPEATEDPAGLVSGQVSDSPGTPMTEASGASLPTSPDLDPGATAGSEPGSGQPAEPSGTEADEPPGPPGGAQNPHDPPVRPTKGGPGGGSGPGSSGPGSSGPGSSGPPQSTSPWATGEPDVSTPPYGPPTHSRGGKPSWLPEQSTAPGPPEHRKGPKPNTRSNHSGGNVTQVTPNSRHDSLCPPVSQSKASDCRGRGERHSSGPPG